MRCAGSRSLFSAALLCCLAVATQAKAADVYRFTYRGLEVGETASQQVDYNMNLVVSIEQAGQTIDSTRHAVVRKQRCRMTVLETGLLQGAIVKTKVRISYDAAEQSDVQNDDPAEGGPLPVVGKTYFAALVEGKLVITDEKGKRPSDEEWAIVATATDTLGKPNPIAQYFHGKTFEVGQQLRLPPQLAKELLGFSGRLDNASMLNLNFRSVIDVNGQPCALFDTLLDTKVTQGTTMNMSMRGQLALDINTCRALEIQLSGPVKMAEAHGPADGQFTINTKGDLKMALRADYSRQNNLK